MHAFVAASLTGAFARTGSGGGSWLIASKALALPVRPVPSARLLLLEAAAVFAIVRAAARVVAFGAGLAGEETMSREKSYGA